MATKQFLKGTGDNAYLYQETVGSAALGMDSSAATFKVVTSATSGAIVSSTAQFTIDPAANGNVTIDPNGSGATVCQSGDLTVVAGNINMATTSSTVGVYNVNSIRFMHSFGTSNTFVGSSSGNFTLSGTSNCGFGATTLSALTSGSANNALGVTTLQAVTSGASNNAFGGAVLQALTTGSSNTVMGATALTNANGTANCAFGSRTLGQLTTGNYNVAIGSLDNGVTNSSGYNYTGAESSNIVIQNIGTIGESNVLRIGTVGSGSGQINKAFIAGIYGVTPSGAGSTVIIDSNGQLGTSGAISATWTVITASQTAAVGNGYFINKAGTLALALPATSSVGDVIEVININTATGVQFTQAANQQIFFSTASTTLGATGTLTSSAIGDSIKLVCRTANLVWWASSSIGNWTPA